MPETVSLEDATKACEEAARLRVAAEGCSKAAIQVRPLGGVIEVRDPSGWAHVGYLSDAVSRVHLVIWLHTQTGQVQTTPMVEWPGESPVDNIAIIGPNRFVHPYRVKPGYSYFFAGEMYEWWEAEERICQAKKADGWTWEKRG